MNIVENKNYQKPKLRLGDITWKKSWGGYYGYVNSVFVCSVIKTAVLLSDGKKSHMWTPGCDLIDVERGVWTRSLALAKVRAKIMAKRQYRTALKTLIKTQKF